MCIAYLSLGRPEWPILIAANRDEHHDRPSAAAGPWPGHPEVTAGRDLKAGGTWLGWSRRGRFGLLTNYREPGHPAPPHAPSRGGLVRDFLLGSGSAAAEAERLAPRVQEWAGFNLIIGDRDGVWCLGNRNPAGASCRLEAGQYVLSNHLLDTPWPKARLLRARLDALPPGRWAADPDTVLDILHDTTPAREEELPHTGLPLERERSLSSPFVVGPDYGTRCSTVIAVSRTGDALFCEQSYAPDGQPRERHDWRLARAD